MGSHQSKGGPEKVKHFKTYMLENGDWVLTQDLKICAYDTKRELNMHQCRIKLVVKKIDLY